METLIIVAAAVICFIILLLVCWKKIPQDEAGVVTGLKKRVYVGQGGIVVPFLERIDTISLGNIALHVETDGSLSSQGVPISVCTTAVIKVKNDKEAILKAIEQFTGKTPKDIIETIVKTSSAVLEGKLREIVATMTVEDLYQKRESFTSKVSEVVGKEFDTMGLEVMNFTITDISDENDYIKALGEGMIAERRKDAEIKKSDALREQNEKTSENIRAGEQAKLKAATEIEASKKDKAVKQQAYREEQQKAEAKAELAKEIQTNITQQEVITAKAAANLLEQEKAKDIEAARIQVEIVQAQKNTELKEQQAIEKEKELLSEVVKPAEAERKKQEQEAEASKFQSVKKAEAEAEKKKIDADAEAEALRKKAEGEAQAIKTKALAEAEAIKAKATAEAEATKLKGTADAEATKAVGLAEAEATKAQLTAEAEGLEKKAEALTKMNDAGITNMIIEKLPEIAEAIARPMEQIEKITIIGGSDDGAGSIDQIGAMVPSVLKRTIDTVKETTGFDPTDVLRAKTIAAQTDRNVRIDGEASADVSVGNGNKED